MTRPITVAWVLQSLKEAYGKLPPRPQLAPLAELIKTVLSQNTSDVNSDRAFARLTFRLHEWKDILTASEADIADAIKPGGLGNVKAPRIKAIIQEIMRRQGSLDISFLRHMPAEDAMAWLQELPGVGPKTAACVLLFSLGMPALPVDTHVLRVAQRIGIVANRATAEKAATQLQKIVPPADVYDFHVYLIAHGRRTCKAQRPLCDKCALRDRCPSASSFA